MGWPQSEGITRVEELSLTSSFWGLQVGAQDVARQLSLELSDREKRALPGDAVVRWPLMCFLLG